MHQCLHGPNSLLALSFSLLSIKNHFMAGCLIAIVSKAAMSSSTGKDNSSHLINESIHVPLSLLLPFTLPYHHHHHQLLSQPNNAFLLPFPTDDTAIPFPFSLHSTAFNVHSFSCLKMNVKPYNGVS